MSAEEEYNGWSNRSTWMAELHLSNNEYMYLLIVDMVDQGPSVHELATVLEETVLDWMERDELVRLDMSAVGTAWVNWDEIARSWIESYEGE